MKNLPKVKVLALCIVLLGALSIAHAIDVNGRIKGAVTDQQGSALAGIKVTATNESTGVKFDTVTGSDGGYLFPQLPIGSYTISVSASGFKAFTAKGIVLNIDQEYVEPVQLSVGSTAEVVEVAASAVQVDMTDMQLSNVVNSEQMVELPLINRTFTGLELTLPGVQGADDRFTGNYSVSGAQTQQSEYLINGADTNDIALNTLVFTPNIDAIDQFNLIEGPLNAEYDRNSGGIVSATIKVGSNHIHGDLFEFYRDTFLNTANFFQHSVATGAPSVAKYHQNIPGATFGGPILKDRLFGFGAYQGTRQIVPQSGGVVNVFSNANLTGDFSDDLSGNNPGKISSFSTKTIPSSISIPGCSTGQTWQSCLGGKGGMVPAAAFNPISVALIQKYVPAANNGTYGRLFTPVTVTSADQYIGRVDYNINPANQITALGLEQKQTASDTLPFTGATLPGFGDKNLQTIRQYTGEYIHQFSPTMVNDFAGHYTRFNYQAVLPQTVVSPSSLGFNINPQNAAAASVPTIAVSGFFTLGFSTNGPQPRIDQVYQVDDNVSKALNRHSLKFGVDARRFNVTNPFSARNSGSYTFTNTSSSPYSTGDPSLDFLLGIPGSYAQSSGNTIEASAFLTYFYGQDTWKLTSALTLSYGVGYSVDTPLRNHQDRGLGIACFIPGEQSKIFATSPIGLVYPGDGGCTNAAQATTRRGELGPRVGFAWSPDLGRLSNGATGKFVIRGGFGIYYNRTEEESALQTLNTPPFSLASTGAVDYGAKAPQFANPWADLSTGTQYANKFPFSAPAAGATVNFARLEPTTISTYGPGFRAPYAENIQLSIEREFPSLVIARISYVGSLARHNQIDYEGNYETAAGHAACLATPACVADANFQSRDYPGNTAGGAVDPNTGKTGVVSAGTVGSGAASSYHSLQASVQKGLTRGLTFQLSYTYGHALDAGSSFENSGFGSSGARGYNQFNTELNYGDSSYDVRHRLVFAPIFVVPQFRGSDYSVRNLALAGWEVAGIATVASGFPYDISYAGTTSRSLWCSNAFQFYACPDVPVQNAPLARMDPRVRNSVTGNSVWFSPSSFAAEPIGSFGNVHRDPYHGPGINNTNIILAKNFVLNSERGMRLQLRIESDNVFNHTQFSNPTSTFGNSLFGQISSAASSRQSQLAGKFYF